MKLLKNNLFWMILSVAVFLLVIIFRCVGDISDLNYAATCFAGFASGLWINEVINEKRG